MIKEDGTFVVIGIGLRTLILGLLLELCRSAGNLDCLLTIEQSPSVL